MNAFLLSVVLSLLVAAPLAAQPAKQYNLDDGVILHGYDAVAYLDERKATEGKSSLTASHNGATYRFATEAHRQAFLKNPARYEPAYGGWCAYAMGATGEKVDFDPETFKIVDGRLYVFYNAFFNNTLKSWNKDEARLKAAADANWRRFTAAQ